MHDSVALYGFRILLIEDDDDIRSALAAFLEVAGASLWAVGDAEAGLRLLDQYPFDVVVSDIVMPHRDGLWLIRELRAHERYRSLPAVAVTSQVEPAERRLILAAGYDAHVPKPGGIDELVATIVHVVAAARDRAGS
jgi:CheY-like chemotaxis protein